MYKWTVKPTHWIKHTLVEGTSVVTCHNSKRAPSAIAFSQICQRKYLITVQQSQGRLTSLLTPWQSL